MGEVFLARRSPFAYAYQYCPPLIFFALTNDYLPMDLWSEGCIRGCWICKIAR